MPIILFALCSVSANSQVNNLESHSMIDIISFFEKKDNVKFSYSDDALNNVKIKLNKETTSFQDFIKAIENQTIFVVKNTDAKNYIIYKNTERVFLCGKVVDSYTNAPLSDVLVTDSENSIYTDENGEFSIETKKFRKITFTGYGYNSIIRKVKEIYNEECATIKIYKSAEELDEIILVTDYITLGVNKKGDGSISLNPSELKFIPGLIEPDVLQSIQLLPGINSPLGGAADISIRGGSPDQNLILWDGIKIYNSGHFFDQISSFNPYVTESTNIFTSGTTAKFSLHTGGVIDISSITKVPKKISGNAAINLTNYNANVNLPIRKNIGLIVAGRHSENTLYDGKFNNIKKKVFNDTSIDDQNENEVVTEFNNIFKFYDLNAKIIWDLSDKSKIQLSGIYMDNVSNFDSEIAETFKNKDSVRIQNEGISLQWKKTSSKNIVHNFNSYYSNYNYNLKRNESFGGMSINSNQLNTVTDIGTLYHLMFNPSKKIKFLSGYEYTYNDVSNIENNEKDDFFGIQNFIRTSNLSIHSIFSEILYDELFLKIQAGLRANYLSELSGITIEPRFLTTLKLTKKLHLSISAEWKNQVLRQSYQISNNRLPFIKNAWVLTTGETADTKAIPSLGSQQFSLGVNYNIKDFGIIFESYLKKNQGLVSLNNDTETINDDLYFSGKGTVVGLDLLIKKKIGNYRTWLGYSLGQNLLFFPDLNEKEFLNNIDTTHIFNWSNTFIISNFEFGLSWNYRTGLRFSEPSNISLTPVGEPKLEYEKLNNLKLPHFQNINASVLYSTELYNNIKIKFGVSVQNLLNRKNLLGREYKLNPVSNEDPFLILNGTNLYKQDNISLPLTPDLLLRIKF